MRYKYSVKDVWLFLKKNYVPILFLLITAGISLFFIPYLLQLRNPETQAALREWISAQGAKGVLIVLAMQVLQIVIAVLPGEPLEVLAGVLYGTLGGLILCEVGILLGSVLVYYGVRRFGLSFICLFIKKEEIEKYTFLQDSVKVEALVFLLFFLPGTPKDALTYLAPMTSLSPGRFFFIATFARIPSVVTSTLAGSTLAQGNLWASALIFIIIGAIGLGGIYYQQRFLGRMQARKQRRLERKNSRAATQKDREDNSQT